MAAWEFQTLQNIADRNGWHKFVSMQNYYNLLYREEEREMVLSPSPLRALSTPTKPSTTDPLLSRHGGLPHPLVPRRPRRPHTALERPQHEARDDRQVSRPARLRARGRDGQEGYRACRGGREEEWREHGGCGDGVVSEEGGDAKHWTGEQGKD